MRPGTSWPKSWRRRPGSPPTMRVCLVNDTSHNPNWGCRATSRALKDGLERAGHEIVSSVYLEELQGFTPADRRSWRRTAEWLDKHTPRRPYFRNLASSAFDKVRPRLPDVVPKVAAGLDAAANAMLGGAILESVLARLSQADGVVINGEGAIYGAQRLGKALMFIAYVAKVRLRKWVGFVNHTADLADPTMRELAEHIYPRLDLVAFRDRLSLASCTPFLPSGLAVPDAAFSYHPVTGETWFDVVRRPGYFDVWPDSARFDPAEPYVAVGGSALLSRTASLQQASSGYAALVAALRKAGVGVLLTASDVPDERVFRRLAADNGLPLVGLATPVQQAVDLLAGARAYVGGRWHPAIFGLLGGTPFVPLSTNSHKLKGLAEEFGLPQPRADASDLTAAVPDVLAVALDHINSGAALRQRLRAQADRQRVGAAELFDLVPGARAATSADQRGRGEITV